MVDAVRDRMPHVKPVKAGWWNAFRPWTLYGAVVPVLIGGAVACYDTDFDALSWAILVLIVAGGCLLQSAANLLNTYGDYKKGTDTVENETRSPELVTGVLKPGDVKRAGILCLLAVCALGLVFIWYCGWGIMVYGILGLAAAGTYTTGVAFKYHGMGPFVVCLAMGLLMPMGTYYVLTGESSWDVLLLSLPNAFLITAVLCGNETRDYQEDKDAGVRTLCSHFTRDGALRLYLMENIAAFPILALLIVFGAAPWPCVIGFLALYDLRVLYTNAKESASDPHANFMLVPLAFRMNWHLGLLLVAGYVLGNFVIPVI